MAERRRHSGENSPRQDLIRENSDLKMKNRKLEKAINLLKANLENGWCIHYRFEFLDLD